MTTGARYADVKALTAIVRSIVERVDPERIILFGSAARGEMGRKSDIDLLVVKDQCRRLRTAGAIYANLPRNRGRAPVHVTVVWPQELIDYKDAEWRVIPSALREGKVLYDKNTEAVAGGGVPATGAGT